MTMTLRDILRHMNSKPERDLAECGDFYRARSLDVRIPGKGTTYDFLRQHMGDEWQKLMNGKAYRVKYQGVTVEVSSWGEASHYARLCGAAAFYDCDDGRTFFYESQADCDAAENGLEIGAIEEVQS
jgi:hypothetical protein